MRYFTHFWRIYCDILQKDTYDLDHSLPFYSPHAQHIPKPIAGLSPPLWVLIWKNLCGLITLQKKEGFTMQSTSLNNAQLEILDMMSFVKSQEVLADLKQVISNYFASELEKEMNRLWETGEMTEEKVEGFRNLHERTPYK